MQARRNNRLAAAAAALAAGALLLAGAAGARPADTVSLTVYVSGAGSITGPGIRCGAAGNTCSASYPAGTTVTLAATGTDHSLFSGWAGSCGGTQPGCKLTLAAGSPATVWGVFGYVEVVDVSMAGTGAGTVRSAPQGIDCGEVCARAFAGGTPVTLTAVPARGSVFAGWGGWCEGKRVCTVSVAYGTAPIVARFEKKGVKPPPPPSSSFTVEAVSSTVITAPGTHVIAVSFKTSQAAQVELLILHGGRTYDSAGVSVKPGLVTVQLPLGENAPKGAYTVVAVLTSAGETRRLTWNVSVP